MRCKELALQFGNQVSSSDFAQRLELLAKNFPRHFPFALDAATMSATGKPVVVFESLGVCLFRENR